MALFFAPIRKNKHHKRLTCRELRRFVSKKNTHRWHSFQDRGGGVGGANERNCALWRRTGSSQRQGKQRKAAARWELAATGNLLTDPPQEVRAIGAIGASASLGVAAVEIVQPDAVRRRAEVVAAPSSLGKIARLAEPR